MKMTIQANIAAFERQVQEVMKAGRLSAADALNKNAVKVLIGAREGAAGELSKGAVQLTPKASKGQIRRDLDKKYKARTGKRFGMVAHSVKLLFIRASKDITKNGGAKGLSFQQYRDRVAQVSEKIAKARDASRAYLAAGWLNCLKGLNFRATSKGVKLYPDRKASKSYSLRAQPQKLEVACYNAAADPGTKAGEIVEAALVQAIANATADMETYTKRKMEEAMQRSVTQSATIRFA